MSQAREMTIYDDFLNAVDTWPHHLAAVAIETESGRRRSLTYAELAKRVDQVAQGLKDLGVNRGDVVSVQLPNVLEFPVALYAIYKLGAVFNGLTSIFRDREVEFILRKTESKVFVAPALFRRYDYLQMAQRLLPGLPHLQHIVAVGLEATGSFQSNVIAFDQLGSDGAGIDPRGEPLDLAQLAFTSGTTGEPKGVMHNHRTLRRTALRFIKHVAPPDPFVDLVVSPVGHQTGFLWGTILSTMMRGTAVYLDIWNPVAGWEAIRNERVTTMVASAPFLRDLVETVPPGDAIRSSLEMIAIPGAPIPRSLVPQARSKLSCRIVPAWGMTEYGIALAVGSRDPELAYETDGSVLPGAEVRVVSPTDEPVLPNVEGDLQIRGEGLFLGYFKRPNDEYCTDGWFRTGDRAMMTDQGFFKIAGRSKDIIIRGGENIPVQDIENVLFQWDAVKEVALVAMPDERLGERACAFIVPRPGSHPTLEAMQDYLRRHRVTPQYWPERVELVDQLPRTASGKVQKFRLRQDIQKRLAANSDLETSN